MKNEVEKLKKKLIEKLNKHYYNHLAKEKSRKRLNDFLFFFLWRLAFGLSALRGVDEKLILFAANAEYTMPNDFRLLYEFCREKGFKCLCLYKFKGGSECIYKNELSKIKSDLVFQKYFARAKVTFLDEYYLPAYANKPRKGSRLVQLWHGCGAFKKFSYSVKDSDWGLQSELFERYHVHQTYTDIVTSGEFFIPAWKEAFNVKDEVFKPLGVPRTDIFFDPGFVSSQRKELEDRFPALSGKKLLLWAPTLRGNDVQSSYAERAIDFLALKRALGNEYALLVRLHPRVADALEFTDEEKEELDGFVFDVSKEFSVNACLCAADICITDYSSLIFEYSLLDRPMIFYAYDLEEYNSGRSFYYEYESFVPGRIAKTTEELIKAIELAEKDTPRLDEFREKFMSCCDGKSTERVFNELVLQKS